MAENNRRSRLKIYDLVDIWLSTPGRTLILANRGSKVSLTMSENNRIVRQHMFRGSIESSLRRIINEELDKE